MTFATPLALLALLLVPLVVLALVMAKRRRIRYAIRYPALDVLAGVVERERRGRWIPAAPPPPAPPPPPRGAGRAEAAGPPGWAAPRGAPGRFLDRLPDRFQVGLVVFSSEAETLVPPTTDREAVRAALASLNANGGTAMGDGLGRALDVIEAARQQVTG